jgi:hypothetical protein
MFTSSSSCSIFTMHDSVLIPEIIYEYGKLPARDHKSFSHDYFILNIFLHYDNVLVHTCTSVQYVLYTPARVYCTVRTVHTCTSVHNVHTLFFRRRIWNWDHWDPRHTAGSRSGSRQAEEELLLEDLRNSGLLIGSNLIKWPFIGRATFLLSVARIRRAYLRRHLYWPQKGCIQISSIWD